MPSPCSPTPAPGSRAAGDIVLNAGNDIHVKDVTILSSGGSVQHALFSADAGHDFIASGNIAINAHASGPQPSAGATVNIFAAHNAAISGDLSVTAKAASSGTGDVSAIAKAQVVGRSVSLERGVDITASANQPHGNGHVDALASLVLGVSAIGGSVQVNSGVRVTALGEGHASDSVTANALANIQSFGNLTISGGVDIAASANDLGSSGNAARAQANLQLHAAAGSVNIGGAVTVNAIALASNGGGTAWANASANIIAGHDVTVNDSGVHILASANHGEFERKRPCQRPPSDRGQWRQCPDERQHRCGCAGEIARRWTRHRKCPGEHLRSDRSLDRRHSRRRRLSEFRSRRRAIAFRHSPTCKREPPTGRQALVAM